MTEATDFETCAIVEVLEPSSARSVTAESHYGIKTRSRKARNMAVRNANRVAVPPFDLVRKARSNGQRLFTPARLSPPSRLAGLPRFGAFADERDVVAGRWKRPRANARSLGTQKSSSAVIRHPACHVTSVAAGRALRNLLTVRIIAAEVFPHLAPALPPPGAPPPWCQRDRPQHTQNPAHQFSLLLWDSGVNYPIMRTRDRPVPRQSAASKRGSETMMRVLLFQLDGKIPNHRADTKGPWSRRRRPAVRREPGVHGSAGRVGSRGWSATSVAPRPRVAARSTMSGPWWATKADGCGLVTLIRCSRAARLRHLQKDRSATLQSGRGTNLCFSFSWDGVLPSPDWWCDIRDCQGWVRNGDEVAFTMEKITAAIFAWLWLWRPSAGYHLGTTAVHPE